MKKGIKTSNKEFIFAKVQRVIDSYTIHARHADISFSTVASVIKLSNLSEFFLRYQKIKNQRRPKNNLFFSISYPAVTILKL